MIEVLFDIDRGWFPAPLTESFQRELDFFQKDIELRGADGEWRRSALVSIYARAVGSPQPNDSDSCHINVEGRGGLFITWNQLKGSSRPHTPKVFVDFDKEFWDRAIDESPTDWDLRGVFSDWLEEEGHDWLMRGQRWQIGNGKTPGPACVQEAAWHEASWFTENSVNTRWTDPVNVVRPEWCLPYELFVKLNGHILQRRDCGHHNAFAKSWNGRREAEVALALALAAE